MISMLSCENTWPHGGLRSPWLPWDMGKGTWAPWAGPRPMQAWAQAAAAGSRARSGSLGPGLGPGPEPMCPCKGSKDSLGPHMGMYLHKKAMNSY